MNLSNTEMQVLIFAILAFGYLCEALKMVWSEWLKFKIRTKAEIWAQITKLDGLAILGGIGLLSIILGYIMMCLNKGGLI